MVGMITVGGAATALADANPSGTGQPSQTCQDFLKTGGETPGNGGNAYGNARQGAGAPSQHDVACFQQTAHG